MAEHEEIIETKELTLHMGPQHPSAHGVLHLIVKLQGERVINIEPDIGYLHRGTEKIAENLLYHQFVPYTDRLDYMCAMSNNLAYVMAVEKLLDLELTERGQYIRVIAAELSRIAGHLLAIGAWKGLKLRIPGEETSQGISDVTAFLSEVHLGNLKKLDGKVVRVRTNIVDEQIGRSNN